MKYGKFLEKGSTIGVVAPSLGLGGYPYKKQGKNALKRIQELGYKVKTVPSFYDFSKKNLLESNYKNKAKEFEEFYKSKDIDILWSIAGGEIMAKTMNNINPTIFSKYPPKMFCGFSDNTWLSFVLPTRFDIAATYAYNFTTLGATKYHPSINNLFDILSGKKIKQFSFDKIEKKKINNTKGNELKGINARAKNDWKILSKQKTAKFEGRIIGGCLDVLLSILGTPFDNVKEFIEKYKKDGFIWYFESCDLSIIDQLRGYLKIKQCGWLKNCKGILIGRPLRKEKFWGISYEDMLHESFDELNIPVIYDCDIGHVAPQITIVNGSFAKFNYHNKKGTIEQLFI